MKKAIFLIGVVIFGLCFADEAPLESARSSVCTRGNAYIPIESSCDSYIECRDYMAYEMLCPDGLHYNAEAVFPEYPCGYPMDVPCKGRTQLQPATATSECPHLFGFYPSSVASGKNCGQYRMCVNGMPIEMLCPTGLAYNPASGRCDWADQVPNCNVESFLGFKCPETPVNDVGEPLDVVLNYRYESDCYSFFSCERGRARLLSCDTGLAFDPSTGRCENADHVSCARDISYQPREAVPAAKL